MVYGDAVPPSQTLPAYLERYLNETVAYPLFEVSNEGLWGFNLLNTWALFKNTFSREQCDAVLLVVCNNDACAFDATFGTTYTDMVLSWREGQATRDLVERCAGDIASFAERHR